MALCLFTIACERNTESMAPPKTAASASSDDASMPPPPPPPAEVPDALPPPPPIARNDIKPGPDGVYTYVEDMPQLPGGGGPTAIVQYIQSRLVYPNVAPDKQPSGHEYVSFTVTDKGKVEDIKIRRSLGPEYDAAVVAALQQLPTFVPGKQKGKPVAVSFTLPVMFAKK
ncbi:energy transducer TonB [Hymenobacter humi]|uniref:Energy transducer TonB n=1 Tax=Hymenobacter humi TaxID=1411620 RepID=A0ABW2U1E9_9BACT